MRIPLLAASTATLCLTGGLPALEFGNLDVVQHNDSNRGLTDVDPAVSITVAPGSTANFNFTGANRGDIDMHFGTENDVAGGVMITAVRENGRDNTAFGDKGAQAGMKYVTALAETGTGANLGRFFIPLETAPESFEFNINTAAAYFPFNEGWLGGHTRNIDGTNGGVQNVLTATSGISIGPQFTDNGGGAFTVNLTALTSHGVQATAQNGVLLVTGQKNEDNYAMSSDNDNGSFTVRLKHNATDGAGLERDPIAFVYVPVVAAGDDLVTAVGRIQSDGSSEISGGEFTVTKLVESFPPVNTTAELVDLSFDITVADATGIAVGQSVTGENIPAGTVVAAVNGNVVTISRAPAVTVSGVAVTFQTPPTQGRWLLEIPGQTATTGTLIVTPCTGGPNNQDNIVSYEWDATLGTAGGWVIESRDIVPALGVPVLEDGATPDEDMFNFVFFTTQPSNPQPTVSITSPANRSVFSTGEAVTITADAADTAPGTVAKVEFYLNGQLAFTDTEAPYEFTTPAYTLPEVVELDVVAEDNQGARTNAPRVLYNVNPPAGTDSLHFNGIDQYVSFGNAAGLRLPVFTLETWFRRTGPGQTATTGVGGVVAVPLITKGREQADQSNLDLNYFLGIRPDGILVADFEDSNLGINVPVIGRTSVPLNEWNHVAATFDGTRWHLYLNGNLEATRDAGGLVPRADSIQHAALASALNSTGAPAGYFAGFLDEVRIWNTPRTQAQIRAAIETEITDQAGLVARWAMNEATGTTLTSTAAGAVSGNLINAPFWGGGHAFTGNGYPAVEITAPAAGTRYLQGQTINLSVNASDPENAIQAVRYYDNGTLIGTVTTAPYDFAYTGAPLGGNHVLTATITDAAGIVSRSESVTVDVTLPGPTLPGYTAGVMDGGDTDIDDGTPAADPANWQIESSTQSPRGFDSPGTKPGDLAMGVNGTALGFDAGILLAANHSVLGNLAATDNSLAPYRGENGELRLSSMDNEDPGASEPLSFPESSRLSVGWFPFADGWLGGNVAVDGTIASPGSNLPAGVTVTRRDTGTWDISGLPVSGNMLVMPVGAASDNVVAVAVNGSLWTVTQRDNTQNMEDAPFSFLYVPSTSTQVYSGQVAENGDLAVLNDELTVVGATVNRGTQGYEITIGDGTIINPANSSLFLVADTAVGPAGDNVMSYTAVGNSFVVFSQDLPGLNGQFQAGGFRFLVVPHDPLAIQGDEVVVFATRHETSENSADALEFTFTRSGDISAPLTVSYTVGGTATSGSDYPALPGTVTFAAGSATAVVTVAALGDAELEPAETLVITLAPGTGYSVGVYDSATGTIVNGGVVIPRTTVTFQQGIDGYTGQWDRRVGENGTAQSGAGVQQYFVDGMPGPADNSEDVNGLIRFDQIFGNGPGQIPPGAEVIDARLSLTTSTVADAQSPGPWVVDRLVVPVDDTTTYASLGGDPDPNTLDGFEGARGASTGLPLAGFVGMDQGEVGTVDVTQIVKAWADGENNYGMAIFASPTTNGWAYNTVGNNNPLLRPKLQVTYTTLPVKDYYFYTDRAAVVNSQTATLDASLMETVFLDLNDGTTGTTELLLRFPVLFGTESGDTIPIGEEIVKAELVVVTHSPIYLGSGNAQTGGQYAIHQMITDWTVESPATSYGNLGPVVGTNIKDAAIRFEGMGQGSSSYIDVTSVVANWRTGEANYGFNVKPETTDGWQPFLPGVANNALLSGAAPFLRIQTAIYNPSVFDQWASSAGVPGANIDEDPDRDGIPVLIEYALGLDPRVHEMLPGIRPDGSFGFTKGAIAAADPAVRYRIQFSDDLRTWTDAEQSESETSVSAQLPVGAQRKFARLKVDYQP